MPLTLKEYGLAYEPSGRSQAYGLYEPIADLNANNEKKVTQSDINQLEKYADRLFASLNIDVEFTKHFMDRVNDARNQKQITPAELTRLFKQSYKKYGKKIAKLGPDAEAVINDMQTDINMPFALKLDGQELDLIAKTVMRKKDFKTKGPKMSFEQFRNESLWANIHKKRQRIKQGSGEKMRKKGDKGAPTPTQLKRAKGD